MGLLDDYSSGVGFPRPKWQHQEVMDRLHFNARTELREQGIKCLTEATVTDDWDDLAPDVVFFDRTYHPLTMVEITHKKQLKAIMNKCYELIERFPESEYFIYDYETELLYMYDAQADCWLSSLKYELFSAYLSRPLITYLTEE